MHYVYGLGGLLYGEYDNSGAFGKEAATGSATVDLRFPGQYRDAETGLHYNWNRYYNTAIGRYVSSDPIGLAGGLNTYSYVSVSPVMFSDPEGLDGDVSYQPDYCITCTFPANGFDRDGWPNGSLGIMQYGSVQDKDGNQAPVYDNVFGTPGMNTNCLGDFLQAASIGYRAMQPLWRHTCLCRAMSGSKGEALK